MTEVTQARIDKVAGLIEAESWTLVHVAPDRTIFRAERLAPGPQRSESSTTLGGLLKAVKLCEARLRSEELEDGPPITPVVTGVAS